MQTLSRHILAATAALLLCSAAPASGTDAHSDDPEAREKVTRANYALAERFSAKKVGQMVFSTRITPNWFAGSDRFWYEWYSKTFASLF